MTVPTEAAFFAEAIDGVRQQLDNDPNAAWTITDDGPLKPRAAGIERGRRYRVEGVGHRNRNNMNWTLKVFPRDNNIVINITKGPDDFEVIMPLALCGPLPSLN